MTEDNNDKTMRLDNQAHGKQDDDKTVRADGKIISSKKMQNDDSLDDDATVRTDSNTISADQLEDDDSTVRTDSEIISSGAKSSLITAATPMAAKRDSFMLNDKSYTVEKIISESTGEAQIYLLKNEKNEYSVLKLYYPNIKPKEALLKKLRGIQHEDIIKVFDFGFFEGRFFELLEYAAGGTVDKYLPLRDMKRIKEIVAETTNALKFCHKNQIIHRDIKPGNIFYKNADGTDILIGDFGISSLLDEDMSMQQTGQARTAIYAAPELYQSIGGQTIISKEIDYYALGVTLMFIWLGENPFRGIDELSLMRIKNDGKIPIPEGLPAELNKLIRGLTIVNKEKRWGADEIGRWLQGEDVELWEEKIVTDYKTFYFDPERNLVANDPKEIASLMLKDPQLGVKYLYRGKITKWLEESKNQKLAVEIDEIYESLFPKDENAGVKLTAYILDPEIPYEAVDGTKCRTLEEFADVFENNYNEYIKKLKNKNDDFYLYLISKGNKKQAENLQKFFKDYGDDLALLHIIYSLNPAKPFKFVHPKDDDGKTVSYASTTVELCDLLLDHSETGEEYLYSGKISAWLEFKDDKNTYDWIEYIKEEFDEKDRDAGIMATCYVLDGDLPYLAADEKTECSSMEEFGYAIWNNFEKYKKILKNQNNYMYMYFLTRRWDEQLDYAKYCFDSKQHKKKIGVYNVNIAVMKIIRLLGVQPEFEIGGAKFSKPEDLINTDPKVRERINEDISKGNSKLNAWLSIFYHEDPFIKDPYESKLKEYLDIITRIHPGNDYTKRFNSAAGSVKSLMDKNRNIDSRFIYGWVASMLFPVAAAVGLILYYLGLDNNPLPGAFWNVSGIYYLIIIGIVTIFVFIGMKEDGKIELSTGCVGGPIIGGIAAVILYYAFYFALSNNYVFIGLILGALGFFLYKIYLSNHSSKAVRDSLYNESDEDVMVWEPMKFAFGNETEFKSSKAKIVKDNISIRRRAKFQVFKYSFLGTLVFLSMLELLLSYNPEYFTITDMIEQVFNSIF